MPSVAVRVHAQCRSCAQPVPFNALVLATPCPSCDAVCSVTARDWAWILEAPDGVKSAEGATLAGEAVSQEPTCESCKVVVDGEGVATTGSLTCSCGATIHARRPPAFAACLGSKGWDAVLGEDPTSLDETHRAPPLATPIQFPCPSCAASLSLDGSTRAPTCRYCQARSFLPDALWRELRPPRLIRTWFLWIDRSEWTRRQEEASAERRAKSEVVEQQRVEQLVSGLKLRVALSVVAVVLTALGAYCAKSSEHDELAGAILGFGAQVWLFSAFEVLRMTLQKRDEHWWVFGALRFRCGRILATAVVGGSLAAAAHYFGNSLLVGMALIAGAIGFFMAIVAFSMPEEMAW